MSRHRKSKSARDDREIIAPFAAFSGAVVSYFVAEGVLAYFDHPLHWMTAIAVGVLSYIGVLLWYSRRHPRRRR